MINMLGQLISPLIIFTLVSIYTPQISWAKSETYQFKTSNELSKLVTQIDKQIARAERRATTMDKFTKRFAKRFDKEQKRLERQVRRAIRKENKTLITSKLLKLAEHSPFVTEAQEMVENKDFDLEKDIVTPYFSTENQEIIKAKHLNELNQYTLLADYLKDMRSKVLGEKYVSFKPKIDRAPADAVGFFLTFIGGALLACLGGLISLFLPVAGLVIMIIGTTMIVGAGIWAVAND